MPVHDLGYRPWTGRRMSRLLRPWVVAKSGIALVWRRRWLRLLILLAWLPIAVPAMGIFVFEYSSSDPQMQRAFFTSLTRMTRWLAMSMPEFSDHESARHPIWSTFILIFFRVPQLFSMVLLVGIIAPILISYDLRSKAYLMYFSRPLSPMEYILGKSAVIWFFLMMITTVPALMLYVSGILLSPDLSVIAQTWDIPVRILIASFVLVVPTTALALCYSSFTAESRYATFTWFATWVMGYVAYTILTRASATRPAYRPGPRWGPGPRRRPPTWEELGIDWEKWRWVSPYHTLGKVEAWVFGLDSSEISVVPSIIILVVVTVGCIWIIRNRIVRRLSI